MLSNEKLFIGHVFDHMVLAPIEHLYSESGHLPFISLYYYSILVSHFLVELVGHNPQPYNVILF